MKVLPELLPPAGHVAPPPMAGAAPPLADLELDIRPLTGMRVLLKRAMDLVLGSALAIVATPLIIVLALWSWVALRTWPFFTQQRVGQFGGHFTFVKIRTMPRAAPPYALKTTLDQSALPRMSRWMRHRHLDELPQLWLVPFGRMSLVGPRPKMPDDAEPVDPAYAFLCTRVPQGCTGMWQVSVHQSALPADAPEYPLFYLRHGGIRLDLWILWRTALQMFGNARRGTLEDVPAWARGRGWLQPTSGF